MFSRLLVCACAAALLTSGIFGAASARAREHESSENPAPEPVEFFTAIKDGRIAVTVIPRDSTRLTLQVANQTDKPLTIQAPPAFAAVPVAAQFGPAGPGGIGDDLFGGNGNQGNQAVGAPFNFQNGAGNNLGANQGPFGGPGFFNVPAGKTIKQRLSCVCLEFGKPEPRPRIDYEIKPLEQVADDPAIAELLTLLADERFDQRVVQLAVWHLANGKNWQELADLEGKHINGRRYRLYDVAEIALAKRIVERLPSRRDADAENTESLSQR